MRRGGSRYHLSVAFGEKWESDIEKESLGDKLTQVGGASRDREVDYLMA